MVQFVNVRELKIHASEVIRRSRRGDVVVTMRGKPQAVIHALSEDNLEAYLMEHSPAFLKKMDEAVREARAGKLHSYEEVFGHAQPKVKPKRRL